MSSVGSLTVPHFSTLPHKWHYFRGVGEFIEYKMCVLIFSQLLCTKFLVLRRIQRDIIVIVNRSSCKASVFIEIF